MFIEMPIPIFPSFLKIDISDIPALVAGLALGPIAGFMVEFIKNLLHLITSTQTGGVGELANVIVGGSFVVTSSMIYRKNRDAKSYIKAFLAATIVMTLVGSIVNYFFLLPFYGQLMGMDAIIGMGKAVNPKVNDLLSFVLWFIAPFNLLKGLILSILSVPFFKKLDNILKSK
ncbi:ECF transporter S component [Peptostreptococcus equinus]|uniref:Riboflavin transporter n=2 Tax=Peptostreptococcus equinus TaxID=3003601 RepID=A0ABY7JUP0_9FIRM|nr:ECF transporter S component [Peptostreptococcus sp. CBA3647]WAW15878.1 ECF transporter S component [Peptostreptococcus sp. CBA3647]